MQEFKMENVLVGERIRSIRESYNMSREKFSEIIDVSEVFLGQIERGERSLSIKTLRKIVNYSGVSSDFILFGDVKQNDKISQINNILSTFSSDVLDYIYEFIRIFYKFFSRDKNWFSFLFVF